VRSEAAVEPRISFASARYRRNRFKVVELIAKSHILADAESMMPRAQIANRPGGAFRAASEMQPRRDVPQLYAR
jgi:hypothetical protein